MTAVAVKQHSGNVDEDRGGAVTMVMETAAEHYRQ